MGAPINLPPDKPCVVVRVARGGPHPEVTATALAVRTPQNAPRVSTAAGSSPPICLGVLARRLDLLVRMPRSLRHRGPLSAFQSYAAGDSCQHSLFRGRPFTPL